MEEQNTFSLYSFCVYTCLFQRIYSSNLKKLFGNSYCFSRTCHHNLRLVSKPKLFCIYMHYTNMSVSGGTFSRGSFPKGYFPGGNFLQSSFLSGGYFPGANFRGLFFGGWGWGGSVQCALGLFT